MRAITSCQLHPELFDHAMIGLLPFIKPVLGLPATKMCHIECLAYIMYGRLPCTLCCLYASTTVTVCVQHTYICAAHILRQYTFYVVRTPAMAASSTHWRSMPSHAAQSRLLTRHT
jgi:hypothetical protein